jgi:hypothetical protein
MIGSGVCDIDVALTPKPSTDQTENTIRIHLYWLIQELEKT